MPVSRAFCCYSFNLFFEFLTASVHYREKAKQNMYPHLSKELFQLRFSVTYGQTLGDKKTECRKNCLKFAQPVLPVSDSWVDPVLRSMGHKKIHVAKRPDVVR